MQIEDDLETTVKHIIGKLNYGYKENIYQLALCYELESKGYKVQREVAKDILYDYIPLGYVRADVIVNNEYIIQMKSIEKIKDKEINQVEKYLDFFNMKTGYIY